jgi:putative restriction endonuclease
MARPPTAFVGLTDWDWFQTLRTIDGLDEANFWQPSPGGGFAALQPGEPFLFKLHAAEGGKIVGCGFYARYSQLPISMAWEAFEVRNGVNSLAEMRARVQRYRSALASRTEDYEVGCIVLEQPVFLSEPEWLEAPEWKSNIQRGRRYRLDEQPGLSFWYEVALRLGSSQVLEVTGTSVLKEPGARYGAPVFTKPRLGQGSFKVAVVEAYQRRCAVTGEKVLPVLEAGHIQPYGEGGEHRIDNGLLMRRDVHRLFDKGYLTVTPDLEVQVSHRLHDEFDNGQDYLALNGTQIRLPAHVEDRPNPKFLEWHNNEKYVA